MGQETRLGEARDSLEDITKEKRFAVGVTEEREETKFYEGGEGNGRHINADRLRRGKNGTKVVVGNVDGGHERAGGDNGMEKSVDSGKGGCVGPYFIIYVYLVSSYRSSYSPLSKSMHLVPFLLHHPLKTLEGARKRPLLAMRPANGGGLSRRGQGSTQGRKEGMKAAALW